MKKQETVMNLLSPLLRGFLPLLLLFSSGHLLNAQLVPLQALTLHLISIPRVAKASEASLLLTPQQVTELNLAWAELRETIASAQKLGPELTQKKAEQFSLAQKKFTSQRDSILTRDQQELLTSIIEITSNVRKRIQSEYEPRKDSAATVKEKLERQKEYQAVLDRSYLEELEASLPPENYRIFKAALTN
jgi:hypothetical protein